LNVSIAATARYAILHRPLLNQRLSVLRMNMIRAGTLVALRPVTDLDRARIARWLREPDIQRWWGNAAAAEAEVRIALDSPSSICRIIMADAEPIGYAQALDIGQYDDAPLDKVPAGTWDADLFIASSTHRGRGCGERALALLADEVFSTTLAPAVSLFVSVRNEAAVRAYEKAGFRWVSVERDPLLGPCWLMLLSRPLPR
jgi:aminoglycoside 6'-N-acetyltransferase